MKRHLMAAGALAAALLVVGSSLLGVQASAAGATPRTTIMIAGDSISQGLAGDFTWRYRFAAELARQRVTDVDLVGPRTNTAGAYNHYLVGTGWDQAHAATSGTTLAREVDFIAAEVDAALPATSTTPSTRHRPARPCWASGSPRRWRRSTRTCSPVRS